jgi:signal transduction histidine kinase
MLVNSDKYWLGFNFSINDKIDFMIKFIYLAMGSQGLAIIITFLISYKKNRQVLKPIERMTETTKKITGENLNLRINVNGIQDELRELAETINNMMDRIENSYKSQQDFVSNASHELRTPIAVISGYVNLLYRWGINDQKILVESITAIKNEANNMNELVEKLLFLARNDRKSLNLQREYFELDETLNEVLKETLLIDTKHKFESDIIEKISFFGDRNLIKQALRIFIDNALKYTPEDGRIMIKLFIEDSFIVISIKDSGIGISNEDIKYIFDRFYRTEKSRNKEKGGHGLGLAIAKIIILSHNGKINVRSKEQEGTEFRILFKV